MPAATLDHLRTAQRVLCYGVTGSGKSTAALALGALLGLPVHLVDDEIGWLPGWRQRPVPEQRELAASMVAEPGWILDSAYGHWRDLVLPRAEVILALDYPRWLTLARLVRRTVRRVVTKEPQCNGNVETLRQTFSSESIIAWHFRSFANKRRRMRAFEAATDGPAVLRLTHPRQLTELLAELRNPPVG
ncbi:MAG: adenylate kinase [Luteococcus japonicus]|uniref:adenylate kinase n=1 Tax=Luteococcus sp. TaxID=1969402 RepID=UPI0026487107|nr:adenylate kinase [Luteococcus sp.]MDN5562712.1 adenylate kinase [Luteococcus sp.]